MEHADGTIESHTHTHTHTLCRRLLASRSCVHTCTPHADASHRSHADANTRPHRRRLLAPQRRVPVVLDRVFGAPGDRLRDLGPAVAQAAVPVDQQALLGRRPRVAPDVLPRGRGVRVRVRFRRCGSCCGGGGGSFKRGRRRRAWRMHLNAEPQPRTDTQRMLHPGRTRGAPLHARTHACTHARAPAAAG